MRSPVRVLLAVIGVLALTGLTIAASAPAADSSAPPNNSSASLSARAAVPLHVMHYWLKGPATSCDADSCGVRVPAPLHFRVPAGHGAYTATIAISFNYATHGRGRMALVARLKTGTRTTLRPAERPIAHGSGSTTVLFDAPRLPAGHSVRLSLQTQIGVPSSLKASVRTSHVVVTVTGWATAG